MTLLPDHKIARELSYGELEVDPVNLDEQLQPASLDIRLGNKFKQYSYEDMWVDLPNDAISVNDNISEKMDSFTEKEEVVLMPESFLLADTKEYFEIPNDMIGRVTGRSSIGRLGISIHQTAGLFDPGFQGKGVLEIANVSNRPIALEPGMRIGQMTFEKLDGSANNPYNEEDNKYQGQEGATESRIHEDAS